MTALRLGTRRSALARTQSERVADLLRARGHQVELVEVVTEGDTTRASLASLGGTGVFASALRDALRDGEVDFAVHSLKDLPTAPEPDLLVAAIPPRVDPRDALCARDGLTLGELPSGATVGTGSPRRMAQLNALGLGLQVVDIRGNVGTRLQRVQDDLDAVVLAHAGLIRLDLTDHITELLDPLQMLPAPGQGALALECREDSAARPVIAELDDPETRAAVTAERSLLSALEAGCAAPVGALAEIVDDVDGSVLSLRAVAASPAGDIELRRSLTGPLAEADALGHRLATILIEDGADEIVESVRTPTTAQPTTAAERAK